MTTRARSPRTTRQGAVARCLALFAVALASAPLLLTAASHDLAPQQVEGRVLDATLHHVGDDPTPEWTEAPAPPEAAPLVIVFEAAANAGEWLLYLSARDIDSDWSVELNGRALGLLARVKALTELRFVVPPGAVATGKNELRIIASDPKDDMLVGRARLEQRSLREALQLGRLEVDVHDPDGEPLPARLTFTDRGGALVELYYADARSTAVRRGIAYTQAGHALLELPPGPVTVWAGRGMEWSVAQVAVEVVTGATRKVELVIAREVDTAGWVACDTHIHTLTHSGHGDATVVERMFTIAGEGLELPIATDHNHQIDYRPTQQALQLTRWFTPVVGNEVTSDNGHMNAFPLPAGTDVPPWKETDWGKLVEGIRAKGAQVVILNHPRWPENGKDPLTAFRFDDQSGERGTGQRFLFDCIEIVNSDGPTAPPEGVLPAWFALLNRGERFTAIGSSDSHAVGVIVGQGRTYVPSVTDDPAQIDVAAACRAFKEGRVSVSYGLFATIEIEGRGMGDTVEPASDEVEALVRVRHPAWITPKQVEIVIDGTLAAAVALDEMQPGDGPRERVRRVRVRVPDHDSWLVAIASAPKVTAPYWPMSLPRALAITNPIWIDRDHVAGWSSPRATATARLDGARESDAIARVRDALPGLDDGAALQLLEMARDATSGEARTALAALAATRPALATWAARHLVKP